jgi:PTH1 family peptidyl-tRNA hydrolase
MKLIVGLGNPGEKYAGNRHNVGFMAVDRIADAHGLPAWRKRFQGVATDGEIGGERVLLLKPQTYMNDSGRAVGEAVRFLKIAVEDVIVIYDEIDLAPGKLKVKAGGGNAGHNGLRSISAHIANDYGRVRIGVGHPGHKDLVAGYVLKDFAKADRVWLDPLLDAIAGAASELAKGDLVRFSTAVALQLDPRSDAGPGGRAGGKDHGPGAAERASAADDAVAADDNKGEPRRPSRTRHPAGERANKRQSALAENLRKWMAGRKPDGDA